MSASLLRTFRNRAGRPAPRWTGLLSALALTFLVAGCVVDGARQAAPATPAPQPFGEPDVVLAESTTPAVETPVGAAGTENEAVETSLPAPNSASTLEAELALEKVTPATGRVAPPVQATPEPTIEVERGRVAQAGAGGVAAAASAAQPGNRVADFLFRHRVEAPATIEPATESAAEGAADSAAASAAVNVAEAEETGAVETSALSTEAAGENSLGSEGSSEVVAAIHETEAGGEIAASDTPEPQVEPAAAPVAESAAPLPAMQPVADGTPRTLRVPILMYHYLSSPPPASDIYRRDLSVAPELFAAHLDRLAAEGYTTISLHELYAHLATGEALPEKPVVLTFDDGYRDNYEHALPALRERGMKATFFVVTDFIDEQRPEYLTWEMAREMLAAGMSIESHGRNHVSLYGKNDDYLVWQALGSLQTIEFELGVRPHFISYPAGEYDERTIDIFRSANYWAGLTTEQGAEHSLEDAFEWTRIRVRGTTTADDLVELLSLDWQE